MSLVVHEKHAEPSRADEMLNTLRLRLTDTVSDLKPDTGLFDLQALQERLSTAADELHMIERELRLVAHIAAVDSGDLEKTVVEIESRLAEGWVPPARPANEVIAELRRKA